MAGAKSRPQSQRRGVRERGDPFATTGCLRPKPVHPLLTLRLQTPRLTSAPSTSRPRASLPAPPEAEVVDRSPETAEAALEFFASLPGPERQRALMPELLRLVQLSLYIQPNFSSASLSAPMCPTRQVLFFVGHRWLASRLLQLKRKSLHMSEVVRRCMRFENIRVQVQANLMELGAKRPVVEVSSSILRRRQTAKEEREETPPPKLKDPAADKFAQQLSAGRAGKSSLIWLWALWKHVHALLMRRRRKKGELLERTLVGDLAAPFRHWMIFAVESKTESKMITYTTYLQERQMYTRTAMDLHNKKEDLVLDIQVSENSCVRLEKQLEAKRQNRAQLAQRLLDVRPDMVKAMLSKVLDLTLLEVLRMGYLFRTLYRLHFLTRDLAPLLLAEEDSAWRLFGLSGDQILARWVNSQLAQFKLVANEVLEAMSKRSQDEEADIEWSARETEVYGDRCRALRAMKPVTAAEPDAEAALAMAYGAVCAKEALHPVSMWPLDAKEDPKRGETGKPGKKRNKSTRGCEKVPTLFFFLRGGGGVPQRQLCYHVA
ncbi:unnamed protein product [Effrenium voratum]|nr:unnamed protein product [Effrenium voratum]